MDLYAISDQVVALLQRRGRLAYRMLRLQFQLDDEQLAALKEELIDGQQVAVDDGGKALVWHGGGGAPAPTNRNPASSPAPASYTPAHLAERIRAEQAALETRGATDGERKTITALFADLKGSTALIEGLDPEEARAIIDPALQLMMNAVHRYEGYVAQALGDGVFALFGAPIAHEDHPQRALFAALRMQEEIRRHGDQVRLKHGVPLAMRVGINTGEVVVRSIRKDDLHTDYVPVGHSTNLAARMEQMATPGSILVTAYTHRLTEGYFAFKALGQTQIKGVEEPLNVYEVLGAGPWRTRLQVSATLRGLTRFVGRQSELGQLQRAVVHVQAGHGQIVGVMGEPGLGKSRLFHEFTLLSVRGCLVLEAYSVSHGKATAYLPVIELLKSYFRIEPQDDERTRREKVGGKVLMLDRSLEDALPYLFPLLGIDDPTASLQQMDAQIRRRRTFDALKKLFLRESVNQPVILIFEDLHWIDSETQGFLDTFSEGVASAKILLLVNYRPEYRHEWGQKTYYTQLRLTPFGKAEAEEFLNVLLGDTVGAQYAASLQTLKQLILEKTEGTPFFMEEVVRTLIEDSTLTGDRGHYTLTQPVATMQLPTTVQGVLAARIDRLEPDEKALLQQLAVIGREFPLSLVKHVIKSPEEELYHILSTLQHKEFLYEQPALPEVEYLFKHALTQEVAYNSVLIERRKGLHEQTGQAIEQLYHERLEEHYDELAHHYQRSGNTEKAITYLQKAGDLAAQRSAHAEALAHFTAALATVKTLPDAVESARQELPLQLSLARSLGLTKSFATSEVIAAYTRVLVLCEQLGDTQQLFAALIGLRVAYLNQAELQTARELAERIILLAQQTQHTQALWQAHQGLAMVLYALGEVMAARSHIEHALALADATALATEPRLASSLYSDEVATALSRAILANHLWVLGYSDQARRQSQEALTLVQRADRPWETLIVLMFIVGFLQLLREMKTVQQQCEAVIGLAREQGLSLPLGSMIIICGWSRAMQGHYDEGISQIREGMAILESVGIRFRRPLSLALLAEAYEKAGRVEEGLSALAEALVVIDQTDERFYEAEVYRLYGELTLQQEARCWRLETSSLSPQASSLKPLVYNGVEQKVEECFQKAIEIAQRQQAKSLELRAVMSLVRLRQHQVQDHATRTTQHEARAKLAEARQMLSEIYGWFTEGFDTKDLLDTKALLDELARGV